MFQRGIYQEIFSALVPNAKVNLEQRTAWDPEETRSMVRQMWKAKQRITDILDTETYYKDGVIL